MDFGIVTLYSLGTIAVNELVQRVHAKDYKGAGIILLGALIGLGAGAFGLDHLTWYTGLLAGFAAVGIHTAASAMGGK